MGNNHAEEIEVDWTCLQKGEEIYHSRQHWNLEHHPKAGQGRTNVEVLFCYQWV